MSTINFNFDMQMADNLIVNVCCKATEADPDFDESNHGKGIYRKITYELDEQRNTSSLPAKAEYYLYCGPGFSHLYNERGEIVTDRMNGLDHELIAHAWNAFRDHHVFQ